MTKITKSQLIKQNAEMQNKIDTLIKENAELKVKIQIYEGLPGQAQKVCTDIWCAAMSVAFPSQKQEQQQK